MFAKKLSRPSILAAWLCAAASCAQEDAPFEIPLGEALPPLACSFQLTYVNTEFPAFVSLWESLDGSLHLNVGQDGSVSGVLAVHALQDGDWLLSHGTMAAVTGQAAGNELVLAPVVLLSEQSITYQSDEIRIVLEDSDGDGRADRGSGSGSGSWSAIYPEYGYFYAATGYTADLRLAMDAGAGLARIDASRQSPVRSSQVLPFTALDVGFSEPVRESDALAMLRVLADGAAVTGTMVTNAMDGLITHMTLTPDADLPFAADIALDPGELTDLAGNGVSAASPIRTVADPGPIVDNIGFESGLSGWYGEGLVEAEEGTDGLVPVEGTRHGVLRAPWEIAPQLDALLAGYLDVSDDAVSLEIGITVLSQRAMDDDYRATIVLHTAGSEPREIFDARDEGARTGPCAECTGEWLRTGPMRLVLDLSKYRGQRIWLLASSHVLAADSVRSPSLAMALDDLRVNGAAQGEVAPISLR